MRHSGHKLLIRFENILERGSTRLRKTGMSFLSPGGRLYNMFTDTAAWWKEKGNALLVREKILKKYYRQNWTDAGINLSFILLSWYAGDGDFGMSVAKGFRELKRQWKRIISAPDLTISSFLTECSLVIMEHCGGASGPIWGSAFRAAGRQADGMAALSAADMATVLQAAVRGIQQTGERSFGRGAVVGDKTLIDALVPCAHAWTAAGKSGAGFAAAFTDGAKAARDGAESTKAIVARMGRAGTVGERSLGYPDAGAQAMGVIFTEITGALSF